MRQEAGKIATGSVVLIATIAAGLLILLASGAFETGTASAGGDDETTPTEEETAPPEEDSGDEGEASPDSEGDSTEPEGGESDPAEGEEDEDEGTGQRGEKRDCPNRERQEQSEATTTRA